MPRLVLLTMVVMFIAGCGHKVPEPKSFYAQAAGAEEKETFASIQHFVDGKHAKIECFVPQVSFNEEDEHSAKINVYIDNKFHKEYNTAAFIIKNLETGVHNVKVEVVGLNDQRIYLTKNFDITVS